MLVRLVRYCPKCDELTTWVRDERPRLPRWHFIWAWPVMLVFDLVINRAECIPCHERCLRELPVDMDYDWPAAPSPSQVVYRLR